MNILQISAYAGPTPGNHIPALRELERKLGKMGHRTVYAFIESVKETAWCKELCKSAVVYFLPLRHARVKTRVYKLIRQICICEDISVVHSHFELYDIPIACVAPKNVKVIWHLHDAMQYVYENSSLSRKLLWRLQYGFFAKRSTILSVSERHMEFLYKLGCKKRQVMYFPNALMLDKIERMSSFGKREFLIFSWDYLRKGGDLAIEACDRLMRENVDFKLRAVPSMGKVERKYIISQPPVENINEVYSKTGCFLHISRAEGLSYALLEAAYAGLPIICSDIPENMVLCDCPTVIYTKNGSSQEIYKAMKQISNSNFAVYDEDINRTREIIESRFSLDVWVRKLIEIYLGS